MMEQLGQANIDLTDEKQRERLHGWLQIGLTGFLMHLEWDLVKGADRGIRQVMRLVQDPDYYKQAAARRQKRRAWMQDQRQAPVEPPLSPAPEYLTDKGIELATLQIGIYHVDTHQE